MGNVPTWSGSAANGLLKKSTSGNEPPSAWKRDMGLLEASRLAEPMLLEEFVSLPAFCAG